MMRKSIIYLAVLFTLLMFSCENYQKGMYYDDECDYSNCNGYEPYDVFLDIRFSRTEQTPNPNIYIMLGDFEDMHIIDTIKTDTIENYIFWTEILVPLNYNYTVFAEYFKGDDTIAVIDANFVFKDSYYECDSTCWRVNNENFNVKLKF